jgi:hypothetical protein
MRADAPTHSRPRRWRGKASITMLSALLALAGGAQALAPAPAAAVMDDGACISLGLWWNPAAGYNGSGEFCEVESGGGNGPTGGGGGGDAGQGADPGQGAGGGGTYQEGPPVNAETGEVVELSEPKAKDPQPIACPAFGCLKRDQGQPRADRDLFASPGQRKGPASKGASTCQGLKQQMDDLRKKIEAANQQIEEENEDGVTNDLELKIASWRAQRAGLGKQSAAKGCAAKPAKKLGPPERQPAGQQPGGPDRWSYEKCQAEVFYWIDFHRKWASDTLSPSSQWEQDQQSLRSQRWIKEREEEGLEHGCFVLDANGGIQGRRTAQDP